MLRSVGLPVQDFCLFTLALLSDGRRILLYTSWRCIAQGRLLTMDLFVI
jgi:hypothetical protein